MKHFHVRFIILTMILLLLSSCSTTGEQAASRPSIAVSISPLNNPTENTQPVALVIEEKIQADAEQLISIIESTHPAFALSDIPTGYEAAKAEFLSEASVDMTAHDFSWLVSAYLCALKDGHTAVIMNKPNLYLNISWQAEDGKLYLLDQEGRRTRQQVVAINDISVEQIFSTISRYFTAENEAAADQNNTIWAMNKDVLILSGASCDTNQAVLTIQEGNATTKEDIAFIRREPYFYYDAKSIIDSKMINDVFYIEFNSCEPGPAVDKTVSDLKKALKSGISKVIIDVRNNPGGDSLACNQLLEAMGMKAPKYGVYIRYSPMVKEQHGGSKSTGYDEYESCVDAAKPNPKIELVVLTAYKTYSSATMLAVLTQDGKLGNIIGQPSANSPSAYGDILIFKLGNSQLAISVSYKRFIRPDTNADQHMLQPDIKVPLSEDPLQSALNYLNNK